MRVLGLAIVKSSLTAALLMMVWEHPAFARDEAKRHGLDVSDVGRLRSAYPHAWELLEKGEALLESGRASTAAPLLREAAAAAPRSSLVARRYCQALTDLGQRGEAIQACRTAMINGGSAMDMRATVGAFMSGGSVNLDDLATATTLADGAERSMAHQPWAYAARCDIAQRLGDAKMLEACIKDLQRVAPDHYETKRALAAFSALRPGLLISFGWAGIALMLMTTLGHAVVQARIKMLATGSARHPS